MTPKLTEADVLFELFLPLFCESKAEALAHFKGEVYFVMRSTPPRDWTMKGGAPPFVKRGKGTREPDVEITLTEDLVSDIVLGRDVDPAQAIADGRLGLRGAVKALEALQLTFAEASSALSNMLKRGKL